MKRELLIKSRHNALSQRLGIHKTQKYSGSDEFTRLREYMVGDDVRFIDYRASARGDGVYFREYRDSSELNIATVAMLGGSMMFGTSRLKLEVVQEIVATIGYSTLDDNFSHFMLTDSNLRRFESKKSRYHINQIVDSMDNLALYGSEPDIQNGLKELSARLKKRKILIFIGDFYSVINFKALLKKHEIFAIIVRDRFEENPELLGFNTLYNPSDATSFSTNITNSDLDDFKRFIYESDIKIERALYDSHIRFIKIYSDDDVYVKLRELFR